MSTPWLTERHGYDPTFGLIPILVLAGAASLKMERITRSRLAGMGLSLSGVAVLNGFNTGRHATLLGNFIVFLSAFCFAVFTVFGKRMTNRHGGLTVTTFAYVGSAIALAPLTLWYWPRFAFGHVSGGAWAAAGAAVETSAPWLSALGLAAAAAGLPEGVALPEG